METLVDVLIPTYNHVNYIEKALDSVLEQKTDFPFRVLVGDDYSTDGTRNILRNYVDIYPNIIIYLRNKNLGLGAKGNGVLLYESVKSKYIALLDGDDYWTNNNKLQFQIDYLETNPKIAGCFHNSIVVDEFNQLIQNEYFDVLKRNRNENKDIFYQRDCLINLKSSYSSSSLIFRSEILQNWPKWFEKSITDFSLDLLITELGPLKYLDLNMSAYRIHKKGIWQGSEMIEREKEFLNRYKILYHTPKFKKLYGDYLKEMIKKKLEVLGKHYKRGWNANFIKNRLIFKLYNYNLL